MSFPAYPDYKDSGVTWLDVVPSHWTVTALKRRLKIVGGSTPKSDVDDYWDGDIPWITPADLSRLPDLFIRDALRSITTDGLASCGTSLVPSGSVILSTRAPIGSLGIAAVELCTNQGCKALVSNEVNSTFLAYLLSICSAELNVRGRGSTFLELSADELGAFQISFPPPDEQTAIATFLDRETAKIDALMAEQERLIALLKEKRQAVISHAVTKGLNPNAPMRDSGIEWLGQIPAHWQIEPLKRLADPQTSITYGIVQAGPDIPDGVPYIRTSDMSGEELPLDGYLRTSAEIDAAYARSKVASGDLVIAIRATIGKPLIVPAELAGANLTQGTAKFSPGEKVLARFVQLVLGSTGASAEFDRISKGSTFKEITLDMLRRFRIPLPPLDEQQRICDWVDGPFGKVGGLLETASEAKLVLQERRAALISAAVTGKIDVRGLAVTSEMEAA
ncbi:restriction endonuclease subunit S [Novosphingobium aerophilum]|uniref:Restriction endonuclease subunit S n=1 Tax=Novosphingobium aerophilum TaxID=2839843 RepID=A0A7X1FA91_9SPHN|nr:restriction endonuclease subunit S [Novosphingobium aerophilum]MBC2653288.1 restriction endonuclease subunit S [Novosphingobium aerophilum]